MEFIIGLAAWITSWAVITTIMIKIKKSKTISIGGGFLLSLLIPIAIIKIFTIGDDWDKQGLIQQSEKFINIQRSDTILIEDMEAEVIEFGTAIFKERTLNAGTVKVTYTLVDRSAGEKTPTCNLFSAVIDSEFDVYRGPTVSACDDKENIAAWKRAFKYSNN
jgi:hypothetical protein